MNRIRRFQNGLRKVAYLFKTGSTFQVQGTIKLLWFKRISRPSFHETYNTLTYSMFTPFDLGVKFASRESGSSIKTLKICKETL